VITEEELLITVQAQRAAKQAAQEAEALRRKQEEAESTVTSIFGKGKAKKRSKREAESSDGDGTKKRVKIGEHFNRARSYSASMQGLRQVDPTEARKSLTPERGILLNKDARIVKRTETKPTKRRRAVDYFY
jgi:hypothetical protein